MHIHAGSMNLTPASHYSAAAEKAAEAQRAAQTRRKLLRAGAEFDDAADRDETFMVGRWMDAGHSRALPGDRYTAGEDPDFG